MNYAEKLDRELFSYSNERSLTDLFLLHIINQMLMGFLEHALKIGLGLALLIVGFVLAVSGINIITTQVTNIYYLGIGVILMIGGIIALKK